MSVLGLSSLELTKSKLRLAAPFLIEQDWDVYTPEQHALWADLVGRRMPQLHEATCQEYLRGFELIGLREGLRERTDQFPWGVLAGAGR